MSRFLVVEDEMILSLLIESMLEDLGHSVAASASNLSDGVDIAGREEFDCGVLDVNLDGQLSIPIAHVLTNRKIPFFFASGYGELDPESGFSDIPVVTKPFHRNELAEAIRHVIRTAKAT